MSFWCSVGRQLVGEELGPPPCCLNPRFLSALLSRESPTSTSSTPALAAAHLTSGRTSLSKLQKSQYITLHLTIQSVNSFHDRNKKHASQRLPTPPTQNCNPPYEARRRSKRFKAQKLPYLLTYQNGPSCHQHASKALLTVQASVLGHAAARPRCVPAQLGLDESACLSHLPRFW